MKIVKVLLTLSLVSTGLINAGTYVNVTNKTGHVLKNVWTCSSGDFLGLCGGCESIGDIENDKSKDITSTAWCDFKYLSMSNEAGKTIHSHNYPTQAGGIGKVRITVNSVNADLNYPDMTVTQDGKGVLSPQV